MKIVYILLFALLLSCGKKEKGDLVLFEKTQEDYTKFINDKPKPRNPNLSLDKVIVNDDYPVEIALYKDGRFYYHLENLGEGEGTYKYEDGDLKLYAEREILGVNIDMSYTFTITKKDGSESVLSFRDRFGRQVKSVKLK